MFGFCPVSLKLFFDGFSEKNCFLTPKFGSSIDSCFLCFKAFDPLSWSDIPFEFTDLRKHYLSFLKFSS